MTGGPEVGPSHLDMTEKPTGRPRGIFRLPPIAWLVGAALIAVASLLVLMAEPVSPRLSRGDMAPGFQLTALATGGLVDSETLRGKVILLNFWATWCKPCEEEMPAMQRLHGQLAGEEFSLISISVDESSKEVENFRERLELTFPILLDPEQSVAKDYQTTGFPESFLVDSQGVILERYVGPREWDHPDYIDRVEGLIEQAQMDRSAR